MGTNVLANGNILSQHNIYTKANIYNIGKNVRSVTVVETAKNSIEPFWPEKKLKFAIRNKAFHLKANRPLANRCLGYTVNKFEEVRAGVFGPAPEDPKVNKFKGEGPGLEAGEMSRK